MTDNQFTCQEFVELATEYLEGKLAPSEQTRFEEHIAVCEGCSMYLEQMRQTIQITGKLTEESIPEEVQESVLRAFRGWKRE